MEGLVRGAASRLSFPPSEATMLAACARHIYSLGSGYHPTTNTILEEICAENEGEAWARLLRGCIRGEMPRLRSEATANARIQAARAAAARRRAQ